MLYAGILVRGGISIGPTFHQRGILYGSGLLKAYEIESKIAIYPRIVIDPFLFNKLTDQIKLVYTSTDLDGLSYVDPLKFAANPPDAAELANDGYDPREIYFNEVKRYVDEALLSLTDLNHLSKWHWLSIRLEIVLSSYLVNRKLPFDILFDETIKNTKEE